jgi:hypothetical protein
MEKVQSIPVSELEQMHKYYAGKMKEASEDLQKVREEYKKLSDEYKLLPHADMDKSDKATRKKQLNALLNDAMCDIKVASASFTAYDEAVEALDYLMKYDGYQAL